MIRAPGKVILMGEYAVVDGSAGVVMSIDRYADLRLEPHTHGRDTRSDLVSFAREEASALLGIDASRTTAVVESSAFHCGNVKLGLGSSAAVTVCSVASVFHEAGEDVGLDATRRRMWEVARGIHNSFQGVEGSGIDIAASLFGGWTVMRNRAGGRVPEFRQWNPPDGLLLAFVWTGEEASTPKLLEAVRRFSESRPDVYGGIVDRMEDTVEAFVDDGPGSPAMVIESFHRYAALMDELGCESGTKIVTDVMAGIMAGAREAGGAAKPSGAGGGDFAVAGFSRRTDLARFLEDVRRQGMACMEFNEDREGVRVVSIGGRGR